MTDKILEKEQQLVQLLEQTFKNCQGKVVRKRRVSISIEKELVPSVLSYAKSQLGYIHLSHISCVDWLEKNKFEIIYILWSPTDKVQLFVKTLIDRENAEIDNIDTIWRQANTYEREIREMYGIQFNGLVGAQEFILEDWEDMPPMRRDFDTEEFVDENFTFRKGREDAGNVRDEITKRSGEEIPDFAKKYSRD
jgi:NADH-quinone oxidoreductase subunit C